MKKMKCKISDLVKGKMTYFICYRNGKLYYELELGDVGDKTYWQFTIPIEDTSGATFYKEHTALNLMRWIRKSYEAGEMVYIKSSVQGVDYELKRKPSLYDEETDIQEDKMDG